MPAGEESNRNNKGYNNFSKYIFDQQHSSNNFFPDSPVNGPRPKSSRIANHHFNCSSQRSPLRQRQVQQSQPQPSFHPNDPRRHASNDTMPNTRNSSRSHLLKKASDSLNHLAARHPNNGPSPETRRRPARSFNRKKTPRYGEIEPLAQAKQHNDYVTHDNTRDTGSRRATTKQPMGIDRNNHLSKHDLRKVKLKESGSGKDDVAQRMDNTTQRNPRRERFRGSFDPAKNFLSTNSPTTQEGSSCFAQVGRNHKRRASPSPRDGDSEPTRSDSAIDLTDDAEDDQSSHQLSSGGSGGRKRTASGSLGNGKTPDSDSNGGRTKRTRHSNPLRAEAHHEDSNSGYSDDGDSEMAKASSSSRDVRGIIANIEGEVCKSPPRSHSKSLSVDLTGEGGVIEGSVECRKKSDDKPNNDDKATSPSRIGHLFNSAVNAVSSAANTVSSISSLSFSKKVQKKQKQKPTPIFPGAAFIKREARRAEAKQAQKHIRDTGVNTGRIEPFTFKNNDLSQGSSNCSSNYSLRSRKKAPNDPVTIDICSDEEEHSTPSVLRCKVPRFAIGATVYTLGCSIEMTEAGKMTLEATEEKSIRRTRSSDSSLVAKKYIIQIAQLKALKYFKADESEISYVGEKDSCARDESPRSFLAMEVRVTANNGFGEHGSMKECLDIVVEFLSDNDLKNLLKHMSRVGWNDFLEGESSLDQTEVAAYTKALEADSAKTRNRRLRSPTKRTEDPFLAGRTEDEILLVFPFNGDQKAIENAASGLAELSDSLRASGMGQKDGNITESNSTKAGRGHYLTVRVEDFERLYPGEYLNDTLIDLWMQWMTRKKGQQDRTHFFSSHFYSALRKGPGKVAHWTKNKGINVFTLDKIFIPINQDFHWSLCVVVNPGRAVRRGTDESASSCIIFLDSLKAHRPGKVSSKIRGWLNTEWNRLEGLEQEPFGKDTMPIISPKIPYQDNGWDCGVFVCKYAHAMYNTPIASLTKVEEQRKFRGAITDSSEFVFDMSDIKRIRKEFAGLIKNLSAVYLRSVGSSSASTKSSPGAQASPPKAPAYERTSDALTTSFPLGSPISNECNMAMAGAENEKCPNLEPSESEKAASFDDSKASRSSSRTHKNSRKDEFSGSATPNAKADLIKNGNPGILGADV